MWFWKGEKEIEFTHDSLISIELMHSLLSKFHILILLSLLPLARSLSFGENYKVVILSVCPRNSFRHSFVLKSQSFIVLSKAPDAIYFPL